MFPREHHVSACLFRYRTCALFPTRLLPLFPSHEQLATQCSVTRDRVSPLLKTLFLF